MNKRVRGSWWGLYALLPITVGLLYMAGAVRVGDTLRQILLVTVAIVVALMALKWVEKHRDLMGSEGVDAQAEQETLRALGASVKRFAPSLTSRQAHYRRVILARGTDQSHHRTRE